ncbi:bL28 family ribosomal protein [Candidatus Hodgkinia cicadicola]
MLIKVRFKPLFGNSVSFSNKKTKRKFCLNAKKVRMWSFVLRQHVKIKASVRFFRLIAKYGGLDFFVVNYKRLPKQFVKLKRIMLASLIGCV